MNFDNVPKHHLEAAYRFYRNETIALSGESKVQFDDLIRRDYTPMSPMDWVDAAFAVWLDTKGVYDHPEEDPDDSVIEDFLAFRDEGI
jgi:hypothetical protein